jgi:hypothetical protein
MVTSLRFDILTSPFCFAALRDFAFWALAGAFGAEDLFIIAVWLGRLPSLAITAGHELTVGLEPPALPELRNQDSHSVTRLGLRQSAVGLEIPQGGAPPFTSRNIFC